MDDIIKIFNNTKRAVGTAVITTTRPFFSDVETLQQRQEAVEACTNHILDFITTVEKTMGNKVAGIVVGKTFLQARNGSAPLDPFCAATWTMDGPEARWRRSYKSSYDALFMCVPFTKNDVHPIAAANFVTSETLALGYENAICQQIARCGRFHFALDNKDKGGGGRICDQDYAGHGIYIAIRMWKEPVHITLPELYTPKKCIITLPDLSGLDVNKKCAAFQPTLRLLPPTTPAVEFVTITPPTNVMIPEINIWTTANTSVDDLSAQVATCVLSD